MIVGRRFAADGHRAVHRAHRVRTSISPERVRRLQRSARPAARARTRSRRFTVEGRWGVIAVAAAAGRRPFGDRELELLGGLAHQAKLAIANASSFEGLERTFLSTVEALANALEARDEYTSSHARWITDTALRVGQRARARRRHAEAARARRALPRHRQDRDPELGPAEARAADRGGAAADRDAPRARREDHRADRPAAARCAGSSAPATSAGTARAIRTARPARRSRSRRGSSSPATRSTR